MSVTNGQNGNQTTFNAAFMSRTTNTDTTGTVSLKEASSGGDILNLQQFSNDLKAQADTNTSDIATNASDIATNASDISTNASDILTNSNSISDIEGLTTPTLARKLINYVDDAAYETAHGAPSGGEIYFNTTSNVGRIHDGTTWNDIGSGSGGGGTFNEEIVTLSAGDISNGYVDLSFEIITNSLTVDPKGGPTQFIGDDYTLSTVSTVTRVTFAGDLAANAAENDKIRFHYSYNP